METDITLCLNARKGSIYEIRTTQDGQIGCRENKLSHLGRGNGRLARAPSEPSDVDTLLIHSNQNSIWRGRRGKEEERVITFRDLFGTTKAIGNRGKYVEEKPVRQIADAKAREGEELVEMFAA